MANGGKDIEITANKKFNSIMENAKESVLSNEVLDKLKKYVENNK